jgi:ribokinase
MASKTITIIGSLNMDLVTLTPYIPKGGETMTANSFSTGAGGKGANQAVACARLSRLKPSPSSSTISPPTSNITVKMVGAVGQDEFGPRLISGMKEDGIDVSGIREVAGKTTGVAVIIVESGSGENRIMLNPGANHTLLPSDFLTPESLGSPLPDLIILQLEIPLETVLQILEIAKKAGVSVLLNPAPAVKLPDLAFPSITHLIVNESEAAILSGRSVDEVEGPDFDWQKVADEFISKGAENVVVTLGSKGAFWATSESSSYVSAAKVKKVVDTTAAGDTFVGAYAVRVVSVDSTAPKGGLEEIVAGACKAAGRTVEKEGAQSAIPWADEI